MARLEDVSGDPFAQAAPATGGGRLADSPFGRLIAKGEGDYNIVNTGKSNGYGAAKVDLPSMTLAEVMQAQKSGKFNAAGRYQIVGPTLAESVKALGLRGDERFTPELQDRIFEQHLAGAKRPALRDYLAGKSNDEQAAMLAASQEWASLPNPKTGRSYYAGDGVNKSPFSPDQLRAALAQSRAVRTGTELGRGTNRNTGPRLEDVDGDPFAPTPTATAAAPKPVTQQAGIGGGLLPGIIQGLRDPIDGAAQMLAKAVPALDKVDRKIAQYIPGWGTADEVAQRANAEYEAGRRQRAGGNLTGLVTGQQPDLGTDWARVGGNVISGVLNPLNKLIPGAGAASLTGKIAHAAAQGAVGSALMPVLPTGGAAGGGSGGGGQPGSTPGNALVPAAGGAGGGSGGGGLPPAAGAADAGDGFWSKKLGQVALGASTGGLLRGAGAAAGATARGVKNLVQPLTGSGQDKIVGDILRQYAHDPEAAAAALAQYRQVVQGSTPITAAAAGDVGLSGLTRTMQAANPQAANELALRAASQNTARTAALEGVAGGPATIEAAKAARKTATDQLRESVLGNAAPIDAKALTGQIDAMLSNPNNAGATARAALQRVRQQVADVAGEGGAIDARALYEIRKDIGLAMQGKLSGDAGNLKYAKGVLGDLQNVIDDHIGGAAGKSALAQPGQVDPWRQYLQTYAGQSKPINQMEALQSVLKTVQTGAVDTNGNAIISAAKLNNLLKTQGQELQKTLTREQMDTLRNIASDANAANLGLNSGKAVGSNTVQNMSQTWLLQQVLGKHGESPLVSSVMRKPLGLLYGGANEQITDRLTNALMDPQYAARVMAAAAAKRGAAPVNALAPSNSIPLAASLAISR